MQDERQPIPSDNPALPIPTCQKSHVEQPGLLPSSAFPSLPVIEHGSPLRNSMTPSCSKAATSTPTPVNSNERLRSRAHHQDKDAQDSNALPLRKNSYHPVRIDSVFQFKSKKFVNINSFSTSF